MRSIEDIKADIEKQAQNMKGAVCLEYDFIKLQALNGELIQTITTGIPLVRLEQICAAEREERCVILDEKLALSMCAGSRAIANNKRYDCASYVYDVFGAHKEISYYEAAKILREAAEAALEAQNA